MGEFSITLLTFITLVSLRKRLMKELMTVLHGFPLPVTRHAKLGRRPRQEEHERVASACEDYDIVFEDN
ncbi:hypothetical protein Aduo_007963 [Ancylostoma duodenale]